MTAQRRQSQQDLAHLATCCIDIAKSDTSAFYTLLYHTVDYCTVSMINKSLAKMVHESAR